MPFVFASWQFTTVTGKPYLELVEFPTKPRTVTPSELFISFERMLNGIPVTNTPGEKTLKGEGSL